MKKDHLSIQNKTKIEIIPIILLITLIGLITPVINRNTEYAYILIILVLGFSIIAAFLLFSRSISISNELLINSQAAVILIFLSLNVLLFSKSNYQRSVSELLDDPVNYYNLARTGFLLLGILMGIRNLFYKDSFILIFKSNIKYYLLLSIWMALSSFWSVNAFITFGKSLDIIALAIAMSASLIAAARSQNSSLVVKNYWELLIGLICLRIIFLWIGAISNPSVGLISTSGFLPQLQGSIGTMHYNTSGFLGLIVLGVGLYRLSNGSKNHVHNIAMILLGSFTLLFSQARASLFSLPILLIFVFVFSKNRKFSAWAIITLFTLSLIGILYFPEHIMTFIRRGQSDLTFFSMSGRLYHWQAALSLLEKSPIIGFGYYAGTRIYLANNYIYSLSNLDNGFIQVLFELGIVGLFLYVLFYFKVFLGVVGKIKMLTISSERIFAKELLLVLILILSHAFTGPTIELLGYSPIIMIPIAVYSSKVNKNYE